ncbi:hypothetical protein RJ641_017022, partial [Dillenia turbinata]
MASIPESESQPDLPPPPPPPPTPPENHFSLEDTPKTLDLVSLREREWVEYAVQQAQLVQHTIQQSLDSAISVSRSRLSQILATSSAHFNQTLDSLNDLKEEYGAYEEKFVGKIKEGIVVAASHPMITSGVVLGLGLVSLKRPRRFLYYKTLRLFYNEETLLARADAKVKELQQSIALLKAEGEKLERRALQAEDEMKRGRTKLKQAGNQIRSAIRSAHKIENQASGLKDIIKELSGRDAYVFRTQVSNLASEAKRERNLLTKEVNKISNHGIS